MNAGWREIVLIWFCVILAGCVVRGQADSWTPPEMGALWVQPSQQTPAQPVWGHVDGLRVGLWPMPGPRGLLRVYAPYLGHADDRMINYIAIEPVVEGTMARSFSELEVSLLDGVDGLRFWSADALADTEPRDPTVPARGVIGYDGDVETLTVTIFVESYRSGAEVALCLTFRADCPYEVGISTFMTDNSKPLGACIVTATMGNYARLRDLYLGDRVVHAAELWPAFSGSGFTPHACYSLDELARTPTGAAVVSATPNESDPQAADYAPRTFIGWKYSGDLATQSWRSEDPHALLRACVNGRAEYWASQAPIPGGIAFENFEMIEPFSNGATFWFGVTPSQAVGLDIDSLESEPKQNPSYVLP